MASAVGFSGGYSINALSADPGLVVQTQKLADPLNFNLYNPGDVYTVDLFKIWTDEVAINADDKAAAGISVDFDFTAPASTGTVHGTTVGGSILIFSGGRVEWSGPEIISFGKGGQLRVDLSDENFNVGFFGSTKPGQYHGATVEAKFTLMNEAVAVPLPASLPLLAGALGGLALFRRRGRATT